MAFVPLTYEQLLANKIAYVRFRSTLTDTSPGSRLRTILEAASLDDEEIYYQMVQMLKQFSFMQARGTELDRRAADFDEVRLEAHESFGEVRVYDTLLPRSYLTLDASPGDPTITVVDETVFTAGWTVRIGEGTAEVEDVDIDPLWVPAGTGVIDVDPLTPLTLSHPAADATVDEFTIGASRVARVSGAAAQAVSSGTGLTKPATGNLTAQNFLTSEAGSVVNGNFLSTDISARSVLAGTIYNAPTRTINTFTSSAPFTGAGVVNLDKFGGGRNVETDDEFRDRLIRKLASLVKATILAIEAASSGVEVEATGQTVTRSKLVEDMVLDLVDVFIDDGSGLFVPDTDNMGVSTLAALAAFGDANIMLNSNVDFSTAGWVIIDPGTANQEILEYTSIVAGGPPWQFNLAGTVQVGHAAAVPVSEVEQVEASTEVTQRFFNLDNIAVVRGSLSAYQLPTGTTQPNSLVLNTDYFLGEGTGQLELVTAVAALSGIYVDYNWYINLIEEVQRVLDGDLSNPVDYPGVRAAGIKLLVDPAVSVNIDVTVALSVSSGVDTTTKAAFITAAELEVTGYLDGLPMGGDVIRHELIERVMAVDSRVLDLTMSLPTGNITILEDEVAVARNINIF